MQISRQSAGPMEAAWNATGRTFPARNPMAMRTQPREEFIPCRPENAPALQKVMKSQVSGFVGGRPLLEQLHQRSVEVSSSLLGGPIGCVLHLSARNGTMHADFRKAGDDRPQVELPPTRSTYSVDNVFDMPNGHKLHIHQNPVPSDGFKDLQVAVEHGDGVQVGAEWEANGTPSGAFAHHGSTYAALRNEGTTLHVFASDSQRYYVRADAQGPDRLRPMRPTRDGNAELRMPESATIPQVELVLRKNDQLLADVERRHPELV